MLQTYSTDIRHTDAILNSWTRVLSGFRGCSRARGPIVRPRTACRARRPALAAWGLREHPRSVWVCENSRLGPSRPKTGTGPLLPSPHSCAFLAVAHECSAAPAGTPEGAPGGTNTCCPPGALGYAGHRPNTGASLNGADETSIQRKTLLVSCPMSCASRVCASS